MLSTLIFPLVGLALRGKQDAEDAPADEAPATGDVVVPAPT
jgi:hypothetical protein